MPDIGDVAIIARSWLGTPFVHQASAKGQGADCLGFVRGVWRELHSGDNVPNLDYAANWFEETKQERLLDGLSGYLSERLDPGLSAGKITLFRLFRKYPAQHVGIILAAPNERLTLIHSISGQGVVEVPMSEKWQARVVAQFRI